MPAIISTSMYGQVRRKHHNQTSIFQATRMLTENAEIQEKDCERDRLRAEIKALKSKVAPLDLLRQENESLRVEIQQLRGGEKQSDAVPRTVLGDLSVNKVNVNSRDPTLKKPAASDSSEIAKTNQIATTRNIKALKIIDDLRAKLRERNDIIDKWAKYADGQDRLIQRLRVELQTHRRPTDETITPNEKEQTSSAQQDGPEDVTASEEPSLTRIDEHKSSPLVDSLAPTPSIPPTEHIPATSQLLNHDNDVTEDGESEKIIETGNTSETELPPLHISPNANPRTVLDPEPSSDGLVFVSAKPVAKRKRGNEGLESARVQRIKSEHSNSSDRSGESHHLSNGESIDFEEETHFPTPRKRKLLQQDDFRTPITDVDSNFRAGSVGLSMHETLGRSTSTNRSCTLSHGYADSNTPSRISSALYDTFQPLQRQQDARLSSEPARKKGYASSLALGVMDLAEDGEEGLAELQHPGVAGRLTSLLDSPSIKTPVSISRPSLANNRNTRPEEPFVPHAQSMLQWHTESDMALGSMQAWQEELAAANRSFAQKAAPKKILEPTPRTPSIIRQDMPRGRSATREEKPLRERPIETLKPDDFKPNPKYNDGLSYVFNEVVRGKEARAALSGCIDPKCCGKTFRHFAEAERKAVGPSLTTRAEDISLMEKYLGDQAWQLGTMSREEKEMTWLMAKTWELANKHGRHRQRYSRMPTPPGFWKVDFPSTQERAEELRQAEEIRRALVKDRYREAMRCGGAWLFRDEEPR